MKKIMKDKHLSGQEKWDKIRDIAATPERKGLFAGERHPVTNAFYKNITDHTLQDFYDKAYTPVLVAGKRRG